MVPRCGTPKEPGRPGSTEEGVCWPKGRLRSSMLASSDPEVPDQVRSGGSCSRGVAFPGYHVTPSTWRGRWLGAGHQHLTPVTLCARVQNATAGPADLCRTSTHLLRCGTPVSTGAVPPWVLLSATMTFKLVIPPRPSPCGDCFRAARDQKLRTAEIPSSQNFQKFGQIVVPSLASGMAQLCQWCDHCWKQAARMYYGMARGKFQAGMSVEHAPPWWCFVTTLATVIALECTIQAAVRRTRYQI
jgi:hypothetical protein